MLDGTAEKDTFLKRFGVKESDLKKLCQKMGVKSLSVFGSAARGDFDPGKSDIDFLVEFKNPSIDDFFDFMDSLQILFKHNRIDMVTPASLKNSVIRREILSTQQNLYAA